MFPPFEGGLAARARRVSRRFSETRQGGSSRVYECYFILSKHPLRLMGKILLILIHSYSRKIDNTKATT
jgi:hypothetical protein